MYPFKISIFVREQDTLIQNTKVGMYFRTILPFLLSVPSSSQTPRDSTSFSARSCFGTQGAARCGLHLSCVWSHYGPLVRQYLSQFDISAIGSVLTVTSILYKVFCGQID